MTVEQIKIAVKSQKCSASAERKSRTNNGDLFRRTAWRFSACQKKLSVAAS
jgi:hypothetical protein